MADVQFISTIAGGFIHAIIAFTSVITVVMAIGAGLTHVFRSIDEGEKAR